MPSAITPLERGHSTDLILTGVVAAMVAVVALHGVGSGLGTHGDSRAIVETSVSAILRGQYVPSRSYGNPLYEYAAALLFSIGGLRLAGLYSMALALLSVVLLNVLLGRQVRPVARFCGLAAVCLNPLFLINAFVITEWMQMILLSLLLLWFAQHWLRTGAASVLLGVGACSALLVLTRPDAVILCAAIYGALFCHIRFEPRRSVWLAVTIILAGVTTLSAFGFINHGFAFVRGGIQLNSFSYSHNLASAFVSIYCSFGPLAPIVLIAMVVKVLRRARSVPEFLATTPFYTLIFLILIPPLLWRFTLLPDKLEYLLPLMIVGTLALVIERPPISWLIVYSASMIVSSVVTVSLFERTGLTDNVRVHIRAHAGAISQEITGTVNNWQIMSNPSALTVISGAVYGPAGTHPELHSENWSAGLLSNTGDLITGAHEAYHLDRPGNGAKYQRSAYRDIYLCNRSIWVVGAAGWRRAEDPIPWAMSDDGSFNPDFSCRKEARSQ